MILKLATVTLALALSALAWSQTQSTVAAPSPDPVTPYVVGHPPAPGAPRLVAPDGSDPSVSTEDPAAIRAQIVTLKEMQASYRNRLMQASPDFQRYEEIQYIAEQKRQQLHQITQGDAQVARAKAEGKEAKPKVKP